MLGPEWRLGLAFKTISVTLSCVMYPEVHTSRQLSDYNSNNTIVQPNQSLGEYEGDTVIYSRVSECEWTTDYPRMQQHPLLKTINV